MSVEQDEQVAQRARTQHDPNSRAVESGADELEQEVAGERGNHPGAEELAVRAWPVGEDVDQLIARAGDRLRVLEGEPARLGQRPAPPSAVKEWVSEILFELAQLHAESRDGQVQFRGGPGEIQFPGSDPEVAQVVQVQEGHFGLDKI